MKVSVGWLPLCVDPGAIDPLPVLIIKPLEETLVYWGGSPGLEARCPDNTGQVYLVWVLWASVICLLRSMLVPQEKAEV